LRHSMLFAEKRVHPQQNKLGHLATAKGKNPFLS